LRITLIAIEDGMESDPHYSILVNHSYKLKRGMPNSNIAICVR
jgi:hypothetical protein